jgi:CheY-like chemotaxis protein
MNMTRILIIDDEQDLVFVVKRMLERSGDYTVDTATNGKAGVKAARRKKPDLILLDILMPKMNGFEVLKKLKGNEKTMSIPVVMLTGVNDEEFKEEAVGSDCENYIVKPVEMEVLRSTIENVLSFHRMHRG